MNDKQPSEGGQEPPAAAGAKPAPAPPLLERTRQAFLGGMMAGMAIAVALAVVMHVIQQMSPNSYSIGGSVLLVLFLGLFIGTGLGMGFTAAVPERHADPAEHRHETPADQPPAP